MNTKGQINRYYEAEDKSNWNQDIKELDVTFKALNISTKENSIDPIFLDHSLLNLLYGNLMIEIIFFLFRINNPLNW